MAKSKPRYLRYAVKEEDGRIVAKFELCYDRDLFLEALAKAQPTVTARKATIARPE
jgi:hypothetical protein